MPSQSSTRVPIVGLSFFFIFAFTLLFVLGGNAQQPLHSATPAQRASTTAAATAKPARLHSAAEKQFTDASDSQTVSFLPAVTYVTGAENTTAGSLVVADVNGDGKPDLVVANVSTSCCGNPGSIGILLGNGDGTFETPILITTVGQIGEWNALAVADVNADGKLDIIVAACCESNGDNEAAVLLGNGDGTFRSPTFFDLGGTTLSSIAVADVNGDGKPDIVSANYNNASNSTVTVLVGNGDGSFQSAITSSAPIDASCLTVADVKGDGKADALVCSEDTVAVLLGDGNGNFQPFTNSNFSTGFCTAGPAVADLNGDGIPDIVAANSGMNGCSVQGFAGVLLGNGDDTFQPEVDFAATTSNNGNGDLALADVNGDGHLDAIVASGFNLGSTNGEVAVLLGNGNGTFQAPVLFSTGAPRSVPVVVTDINGDGKPDIVTANFGQPGASVLINHIGVARASTTTSLSTSLNPSLYGQKVVFTATISNNGDSPATGYVSFVYGRASIGNATVKANGVATLTLSTLNADTFPVMAVYRGDTNNLPSSSAPLNLVVNQATSSAMLTSSTNPSNAGQAVTFTARITSPTVIPTGPVIFKAGKTSLGTVELNDGQATLTTSALGPGTTRVTVSFGGDSDIKGSSASLMQVVQ